MLVPIMMVGFDIDMPFLLVDGYALSYQSSSHCLTWLDYLTRGVYDNFLIVVSLILNALIVWYAWTWAHSQRDTLPTQC